MPYTSDHSATDTAYDLARPRRLGLWLSLAIAALWHLTVVLACPQLRLDDAWFHLHQARALWLAGPLAGITSLPLTVLGQAGPDHHFAFHLLLAPIAALFPGESAMPVAAAGMATMASAGTIAALWWLGVRFLPLWTLLLVGASEVYGFRVSLVRAQSIDLPILIWAVALTIRGRWRTAAALGFGFAWLHHGALLVVPVAVVCLVAQRWIGQPIEWRAALWLCLGTAAGFVVNPWFPRNLEYLFFHVLFKTANPLGLDVGLEWLPALPGYLLAEAWPVHIALAAVGGWLASRRIRPAAESLALLLLTALFVAMSLRHGRFADHLVAVEVAAVACLVRDGLAGVARPPSRVLAGLALTFVLLLASWRGAGVARILGDSPPQDDWRNAGAWLATHSEPGELVLNLEWEDYAPLVYHAPQQRFVTGLDPNYLAYGNPAAFKLWAQLNHGRHPVSDLHARLTQALHVRWLVGPPTYARYLALHPQVRPVFESAHVWIWQSP